MNVAATHSVEARINASSGMHFRHVMSASRSPAFLVMRLVQPHTVVQPCFVVFVAFRLRNVINLKSRLVRIRLKNLKMSNEAHIANDVHVAGVAAIQCLATVLPS
jgi:hypothetical protein